MARRSFFPLVGASLFVLWLLLNQTLSPGHIFLASLIAIVGVWSLAWYDGADRVASFLDQLYARPEMVVWGITGWLLVLGLMLLGSSFAVVIARAAGRRRPLA